MDPIMAAIMAVLGLFKGGGSQATTSSATPDPALNAMMASQQRRTNFQDPLFDAVTRMAMGLLPKQYQTANPFDTAGGQGGGRGGGRGGGAGEDAPFAPGGAGGGGAGHGGPWMRPEQPWSSPDELRGRQDNTRPVR